LKDKEKEMQNYSSFAVARNSDPDTSWEAAHSIKNLTQIQDQVLEVLKQIGPSTDEEIHEFYELYYEIRVSPSTTRTRRKELQDKNLVVLVDKNGTTRGGRRCQRFAINHIANHLQLELI
jgi:hypothetical protein